MDSLYYLLPLIGILFIIFWLTALIDISKRDFNNDNERNGWILLVCLTGIVGASIYYLINKDRRRSGRD